MSENASQSTGPEQWEAFQKVWADTFNKMLQVGMTFSPESTPPEYLKQMRASIFQAMAQSWEEFLRSPQFLDGMKQWMESAIAFRKLNTDTMTRLHEEMRTPSSDDIDAVLVAMRHMEQRMLDRIEELAARLDKASPGGNGKPAAPRGAAAGRKQKKATAKSGGKK
jgi:hypothetical protein